jgi:hypothetical protein
MGLAVSSLRKMTRRGLAITLTYTVVVLSLFAVSHIHGLSDPDTPHAFGEYLALAQAQAGFVSFECGVVLLPLIALERSVADPQPLLQGGPLYAYTSRGPPSSAS